MIRKHSNSKSPLGAILDSLVETRNVEQKRNPGTGGTKKFGGRPQTKKPNRTGTFQYSKFGAKRGNKETHFRGSHAPSKLPRQASKSPILPADTIRIIPLGGVEEIGRNMTVVEYMNDIVIIDAGLEFSDEDTPGIDYIIPNTKYLEERKDRIRGLVITHGHLDHIGAIPYLLEKIGNPPIFTREFGALLIKKKMEEFPHAPQPNFVIAKADDGALPLSEKLKVRFFGLTHSIPDSTGVIIETPFGDIVSTGDVRIDNDNGKPHQKEFDQYAFFKDRNVLLLTMDSTGIPYPGWSISERAVVETIDTIMRESKGRLIIATFASQVERIMEFIRSAKKYGKFVVVEGRAMKTNIEIVRFLNLTDLSHVIEADDMDKYPPHKIVMLATGAQGEEFAALMRIANKTHRNVRLEANDTIVLSSSVIPGNESAVDKLKDNLYRSNAHIITYMDNQVHASGHGKRDELAWIHKQIPYKFFMPIHGHHHRLKMHAELAMSLGIKAENIVVPDDGSMIEIQNSGKSITILKDKAPASPVIVEGSAVGDIQDVVIRDRKALASDGMFVIVATIDGVTGKLKKSPDIISRGFVYLKESQELLHQSRQIIKKTLEDEVKNMNPINFDYLKNTLGENLSKFLFQKTAKRPLVIPVLLSV